eukprot:2478720-Prymnesium_polylepis.1
MRPDPAVDSSRFGIQIPNMYDRFDRIWETPWPWVSTLEHCRQLLCSPVHGVQPPVRSDVSHAHARSTRGIGHGHGRCGCVDRAQAKSCDEDMCPSAAAALGRSRRNDRGRREVRHRRARL